MKVLYSHDTDGDNGYCPVSEVPILLFVRYWFVSKVNSEINANKPN